MKILFSNLPWWQNSDEGLRQGVRAGSRWPFTRHAAHTPDNFQFGGYLPFPFFLSSAAAYAQHAFPSDKVEMRDSITRGESYRAFLTDLRDSPPDWLIAESATPCWDHDSAMLAQIKSAIPSIKIIITGTIVAGCNFKLPPYAHAACKGEYEKNVVKIIRDGATGILDFDLLTVQEMNQLPYPMQDEVAYLRHWDSCPSGQLAPHLQLFTSRGCPHKCVFCAWPATMTGNDPDGTKARRVRFHSPEWVERYIRYEIQRSAIAGTPIKSIYLDDDTLNLTDKHTLDMCEVLKRIGLPWSAMCRADTITPQTWHVMRDSGCYGVKIGIESGSQHVIDRIINKKLDVFHVEHTTLPLLKSLGFTVHCTFTVGLPCETPQEQQETIDLIKRLYANGLTHTHQLSGTAVIEGTPLAGITIEGKTLEKYPDAHMDAAFIFSGDGQRKIEEMAKRAIR